MSKPQTTLICIAHWQTETIEHGDRIFTFSPFRIGQIDGWVLMSWQRSTICDMGHKHGTYFWDNGLELKNKEYPHIPREVWRALRRKTKNVKKEPWPGSD